MELKQIKSLKVLSLANGNMTIEIKYRKETPGVMGRMAIAREIQNILRKKLGTSIKI